MHITRASYVEIHLIGELIHSLLVRPIVNPASITQNTINYGNLLLIEKRTKLSLLYSKCFSHTSESMNELRHMRMRGIDLRHGKLLRRCQSRRPASLGHAHRPTFLPWLLWLFN